MKNILLTLFFGIMTATCFAQDGCKLCGDWVGVYQTNYPRTEYERDNAQRSTNLKAGKVTKCIRINKFGGNYKIRIKNTYEGFIGCVYDEDMIEIIKATDTSIYYKKTTEMMASYDNNDRITKYSNLEKFFLITYDNGYLHHEIIDAYINEFDRNQTFICRYKDDTLNYIKGSSYGNNIDLYKEENDW